MDQRFDLVIVGSGIAGAATALCARRAGLRTLVVERGVHPRFAIGESTTPAATLTMDYLARTYRVPELHKISHYLGLKNLDCTGFPKQAFWFGLHQENQPLAPEHQLMFETLLVPLGPDIHMLRADADNALVRRFEHYGVAYSDRTDIEDFSGGAGDVRLHLIRDDQPFEVRCPLVVDASGHASYFAKRFDLRDPSPRLLTKTRTIFGHFRNVRRLEDVAKRNPAFRFTRDGGTMHHCFDGGFIWVIPFDNQTASVGIIVDIDRFALDDSLSPEAELRRFIDRLPTARAHLGEMEPIRPLIRTGRVQFTSKTIIGDGFILTPHAAGFVDALYSSGLTLTAAFVARFVPLAARHLRREKFSMEIFRPLERAFFLEITQVDKLVSGTIRSFSYNFDTLKQYWRAFVYGNMTEYLARMTGDQSDADGITMVSGAGFAHWRETLTDLHDTVFDASIPPKEMAAALKTIMDRYPQPHRFARYEIGSELACNLNLVDVRYFFAWLREFVHTIPEMKRHARFYRLLGWIWRLNVRKIGHTLRYFVSRLVGSDFHRHVDAMNAIIRFDAGPAENLTGSIS